MAKILCFMQKKKNQTFVLCKIILKINNEKNSYCNTLITFLLEFPSYICKIVFKEHLKILNNCCSE